MKRIALLLVVAAVGWPALASADLPAPTGVTASQDSPDMHGYTDEAIGHFAEDEETDAGARRVITGWWKGQVDGWDLQRWAYLFDTGEIDAETAEAWADEVWEPE